MESKRTILNNILRIVSAEEARNQALTEEVKSMRKELADQWGEICCTVLQTEKTQKTLVAMLRELITEVKKINAPKVVATKIERVPLTNDVIKIKHKEKDLFSKDRTHYNYGENETISMSKAVKDLIKDGISLTDKPYRFFHNLVTKFHIPEYPAKSPNAKSGNYRISRRDFEKIKYILTSQEN